MENAQATQPLLSSGQVAHMAGVSTEAVRAWVRAGKLACTRTDTGMRLFNRADVERFLQERAR